MNDLAFDLSPWSTSSLCAKNLKWWFIEYTSAVGQTDQDGESCDGQVGDQYGPKGWREGCLKIEVCQRPAAQEGDHHPC